MAERIIYCDTNFYLDYFYDRRDKFRPLGEFAFQVIQRALSCEFKFIISDWLIVELEKNHAKQKMNDLLIELRKKDKIIETQITREDERLARSLPTHFEDALHAAIAIRAKAECIVTTNIKDFLPLTEKIECILPQYL